MTGGKLMHWAPKVMLLSANTGFHTLLLHLFNTETMMRNTKPQGTGAYIASVELKL